MYNDEIEGDERTVWVDQVEKWGRRRRRKRRRGTKRNRRISVTIIIVWPYGPERLQNFSAISTSVKFNTVHNGNRVRDCNFNYRCSGYQ
jgi:hypothetical protein